MSKRCAGILGHLVVSIPRLKLPPLPCGDRAALRHEAADSSPSAPVISSIRKALSRHPYGWPLLFAILARVGDVRESAIANCSGLNPKGPGLLLYAMRPCESIKQIRSGHPV